MLSELWVVKDFNGLLAGRGNVGVVCCVLWGNELYFRIFDLIN